MSKEWILHHEKGEHGWLVVDKPAGLSVHNEPGKDLISLFTQIIGKPVAPVFRLDQETSGIIILSLSGETTARWHAALDAKSHTKKEYLCITKGGHKSKGLEVAAAGGAPSTGQWSEALSDKAEGRQNPQGKSQDRKECLTRYTVISQNQYFSELLCQIETGRQHQIRKHAALHLHPIIGDNRYGDKKYNNMIEERYQFARMALHAYRLRCQFNGQSFEWTSPKPPEFSKLLS